MRGVALIAAVQTYIAKWTHDRLSAHTIETIREMYFGGPQRVA